MASGPNPTGHSITSTSSCGAIRMLPPPSDDPGGISGHHGLGWNVAHDHAAGRDHGARSDRNARSDEGPGSHPGVLPDSDGSRDEIEIRRAEVVRRGT